MVLGVLMMLTAVFGFKYLKWLNFVAVPCKVLLVVYAVVVAFQTQSFDVITHYTPAPEKRLDFFTAIGLSIGFFSVGGVISPDYARHATTRSAAVLGSVLGLLPAALGLAACGAMLAIIQNTYDVVEIYSKLGMPILALSVLIIATWRQDSSLLYYSGLNQARLAMLLDVETGVSQLVAEAQSDDERIWCQHTEPEALLAACGADGVLSPAQARARLTQLQAQSGKLHLLPCIRASQTQWAAELTGTAELPSPSVALIRAVVHQREVKTPEELTEIEAAVDVAAQMHDVARAACADGVSEQAIVRAMQGLAAQSGLRMAYPPICTREGHILHHMSHHNSLRRGDLLLIDAGVETPLGYASDISRTHCVDAAWTDLTRLVHDAVRAAQSAAAAGAKPGVTMAEVHRIACRSLVHSLAPLNIFRGSIDAVVDNAAYALLFPHGIGHLLGLDVHDMESLGEDLVGYDERHHRDLRFGPNHLRLGKPLREGMVITVEPGLYGMTTLWERWRQQGLHADLIDYTALNALASLGGVRHEDVFVVTASGAQRLGPLASG
ncbi:MAG: Xaa-Pro aminopeptidase [Ideonella sp. MAG2]|nr:MAG: Xaa-Pro aminopeptidase [Ideonella sp. MAG2]